MVDERGEVRCIHWPAKHIADCGTGRWVVLSPGIPCPGGTEPTTDELLAMLVEEGVLASWRLRSDFYVVPKEVTP